MLAALAALSLLLLVLGSARALGGGRRLAQKLGLELSRNGSIIRLLVITALTTSALFVIFTYLGPLLLKLLDAGPRTIGTFFALFGVAGFIGNVLATSPGDAPRRLRHLVRLHPVDVYRRAGLVAGRRHACRRWPWASCCRDLGFAAANSMQQARLVAAAPELSSATVALNTSSIYVGQALGSALGGLLFEHEHLLAVGYATVVFFGVALAVLALTRRRGGTLAAKG